MAKAQYLPGLLDRLTDDAPASESETSRNRTINITQLRELVMRDLGWLLNATRLDAVQSLEGYDEVKKSVLNFGMPGLSGLSVGSVQLSNIASELKAIIEIFEPRFLPGTVSVSAREGLHTGSNAIVFEIAGSLIPHFAPVGLLLQSELDLDTGQVKIALG